MKKTVCLFGKLRGLTSKLNDDLNNLGFSAFTIDPRELAHPPETLAVIYTPSQSRPDEDKRGQHVLSELSSLIESLQEDQPHLILVSIADANHPEAPVADFGHLDLNAEKLVRESGLPYTIVRTMSAEDRPGQHHKLFWKQDFQGQQKGKAHPITWEDLSQVLVHCINRSEVLSKTFTVHAVAGQTPSENNWEHWFRGLLVDPNRSSGRVAS